MAHSLRDELKQRAPFCCVEQEAMLNVVRTAAVLHDSLEAFLRPYGIGPTHYNVLRILRGAEPEGLCRNELRDRMLTRMPDMTRVLDRMEQCGLVYRERGEEDRRMVTTRLTAEGRRLVDSLDAPVAELHRRQLRGLDAKEMRTLIDLLTAVRQGA